MITIVKFGGAAITDKNQSNTLKEEVLSNSLKVLHGRTNTILVHGAGSFGHIDAKAYELRYGRNERFTLAKQIEGIMKVKSNLSQLDAAFHHHCNLLDINSITFLPSSFMLSDGDDHQDTLLSPIFKALELGFLPVIGGDVVFDLSSSFRIVSGDRIISLLCQTLKGKVRVLFGTDTDGVFDRDPADTGAKLFDVVNKHQMSKLLEGSAESKGVDVTGGMRGKLEEIAKLMEMGVEVSVFNLTIPGRLKLLLDGRNSIQTRFMNV